MPLHATSSATLRTKTGCLTCRKRRKKCDDAVRPSACDRCIKSGRACVWPTQDELLDRRHRRVSRTSKSPSPARSVESTDTIVQDADAAASGTGTNRLSSFVCREIGFRSDLFSSTIFQSDLEVDCFRHFVNGFLPLLLLSTGHPGFQSELVPELVEMLLGFDGLRNALLACGASHLYFLSGNSQMNEAGLRYYARAVSGINRTLTRIDWSRDDFNDAVLQAIIFLYIHGIYNIDTNKDIGKHVAGATQLMKLRTTHSRRPPMPRPIHRIMWESILYQVFRQIANRPFAMDFQLDFEFCAKALETLQSLTFPDASPTDNSPVIGYPLSLQKLIIDVGQLCKTPAKPAADLRRLSQEMQHWESLILDEGHCLREESSWSTKTPSERARLFHQHSTSLHILAGSLLLDWVMRSHGVSDIKSPLPPTGDTWQVRRGLAILRCAHANEDWSRCYLGSWPTVIFGYAVDNSEDIAIIRRDLEQRHQNLGSGEELLLLEELEYVWHLRGVTVHEVDQ
ncbi:hypothetical protein PV04_10945 [Phialophora macrospora]|uniref:Zn(2)-C6 fungal-type domain-containing protein n=1 Tax=Phialophora macrospora TaxID=1851006 RepID=A0A0D2FRY5_9EURO|nr:hypothetical protein PV04_10945 [Phialophora macrospora]